MKLREIYFKKSGKRSASEMLFIAEQIVDIFGIGLPIVHDWRFWYMPIVGNKNIHNLGVFEEPKVTLSKDVRSKLAKNEHWLKTYPQVLRIVSSSLADTILKNTLTFEDTAINM